MQAPESGLSRRDLMLPAAAAVLAAGIAGPARLLPSPAAAALPRALQELTDECETDQCINKPRRMA